MFRKPPPLPAFLRIRQHQPALCDSFINRRRIDFPTIKRNPIAAVIRPVHIAHRLARSPQRMHQRQSGGYFQIRGNLNIASHAASLALAQPFDSNPGQWHSYRQCQAEPLPAHQIFISLTRHGSGDGAKNWA